MANFYCFFQVYYAIHITASQFLQKPRDASVSVARSCNWEFAARISRYILETVQAGAKVTTERVHEVIGDPPNGVNGFKVMVCVSGECLKICPTVDTSFSYLPV